MQISAHLVNENRPLIFVEEEREPFGTPAFWTYAGLALCKIEEYFNLFSLHLLCWTHEWFNGWLPLN
jgi:hypothetical protein